MSEPAPAYPTLRDIYEAVDGLRDDVNQRLDKTDDRLDGALSRLDRIEGAMALVKWLGPAGVAGIILGLIAAFTGTRL